MNAIFGPESATTTDFFGTSGDAPMNVVLALPSEAVHLPAGFELTTADFARSGSDLILTGADGSQIIVQNFFAYGDLPDLVSAEGANVPGPLAAQLSGPLAPGQVAQATPGAGAEPIGQVETVTGEATAIRADGTRELLQAGDQIFQGDVIETADGAAVGVVLADETTFSMAGNGRMVMDEMVFDPGTQTGALNMSVVTGVFTFVSGQIAKADPDAMALNTPVATIGVRGTQLGVSYAEGSPLQVVLMEEQNGFVGELVVSNTAGTLILNQANQGTLVSSSTDIPAPAAILTDSAVAESFGGTLSFMPSNDNFNSYGVTPAFGDQGQIDGSPDSFETAAGETADQDVSFVGVGYESSTEISGASPVVSVEPPAPPLPPAASTPPAPAPDPTPPVTSAPPPSSSSYSGFLANTYANSSDGWIWANGDEVRGFDYAGDMAGGPNNTSATWTNFNGMAPLGFLVAPAPMLPGEVQIGALSSGSATYAIAGSGEIVRGSRLDSDFTPPAVPTGTWVHPPSPTITGAGEYMDNETIVTDNTILGGLSGDIIIGQLAGTNTFAGGPGNDWIIAGLGHDFTTNTQNYDLQDLYFLPGMIEYQQEWFASYQADAEQILDAGANDDLIYGGVGYNDIYGGDDNDVIYGPTGYHGDLLVVDYYRAQSTNGTIGNNFTEYQVAYSDLNTRDGANFSEIDGGLGNDTVFGGVGDNLIHGGLGDDWITASGYPLYDGLENHENIAAEGHGHGAEAVFAWFQPDDMGGDGLGTDLSTGFFGDYFFASLGPGANFAFSGTNMDYSAIWNVGLWQWEFQFTADEQNTSHEVYGDDGLATSPGNDTIRGGVGNNVIFGEDGNDWMLGSTGYNTASFDFAGDDTSTIQNFAGEAQWAYNSISGNDGNDTLVGGYGFNWLDGGAGNDWLGPDVNNTYLTGIQNDFDNNWDDGLVNGNGDISDFEDYIGSLPGTSFTSVDFGDSPALEGHDSGSNDGQKFDDFDFTFTIDPGGSAYTHNDLIDNVLIGGGGEDTLYGGDGNTIYFGGTGPDYLSGGINGTDGRDIFIFNAGDSPTATPDVLSQFGSGDVLFFVGETLAGVGTPASISGSGGVTWNGGTDQVTLFGTFNLTEMEVDWQNASGSIDDSGVAVFIDDGALTV